MAKHQYFLSFRPDFLQTDTFREIRPILQCELHPFHLSECVFIRWRHARACVCFCVKGAGNTSRICVDVWQEYCLRSIQGFPELKSFNVDKHEGISKNRSERPTRPGQVGARSGAVRRYGEHRRPELGSRSSFLEMPMNRNEKESQYDKHCTIEVAQPTRGSPRLSNRELRRQLGWELIEMTRNDDEKIVDVLSGEGR